MDNDILNLQAGKYCTFTFIYMQELCVKDTTLCIILFFHYGSKLALNHVPKSHEQVTCENVNCHVKTDMRRTYWSLTSGHKWTCTLSCFTWCTVVYPFCFQTVVSLTKLCSSNVSFDQLRAEISTAFSSAALEWKTASLKFYWDTPTGVSGMRYPWIWHSEESDLSCRSTSHVSAAHFSVGNQIFSTISLHGFIRHDRRVLALTRIDGKLGIFLISGQQSSLCNKQVV